MNPRPSWVTRWWWVPPTILLSWLLLPTFTSLARTRGVWYALGGVAAGLLIAAGAAAITERAATREDSR